MSNSGYGGWENYVTWNVKLWMDNDQGSREFWDRQAKDLLAEHTFVGARFLLQKRLEAHYDEDVSAWIGKRPPCCFSDLLRESLREVSWWELADQILEAVQTELQTGGLR